MISTHLTSTTYTGGNVQLSGNITCANINFTGALYQNGVLFEGGSSQWSNFGSNIAYTKGNVGIGTTSPSYALNVDGTIYATGDVLAFSDMRVKSNIRTIDNALEKVNNLRGVYYKSNLTNKESTGVIAQEMEKVLPEVVSTDDEGYKSVAYGNIVGILIEAIKEQNIEIRALKERLSRL